MTITSTHMKFNRCKIDHIKSKCYSLLILLEPTTEEAKELELDEQPK